MVLQALDPVEIGIVNRLYQLRFAAQLYGFGKAGIFVKDRTHVAKGIVRFFHTSGEATGLTQCLQKRQSFPDTFFRQ